jgi:hypothetical protein
MFTFKFNFYFKSQIRDLNMNAQDIQCDDKHIEILILKHKFKQREKKKRVKLGDGSIFK